MIYTDGTPTIASAGSRPHAAARAFLDNVHDDYRLNRPHGYTFARFTDAVRNTQRFGHPDPPHLRGPHTPADDPGEVGTVWAAEDAHGERDRTRTTGVMFPTAFPKRPGSNQEDS